MIQWLLLLAGIASNASASLLVKAAVDRPISLKDPFAIGNLIYTRYLFIFEGAGLVLLVAMIGAIVLTHRERGGTRYQNVSRQNARRPQDATRNVNQPVGLGVEL